MDVGIALPQYDYSVPGERPLRWSTVVRWATEAERLGFSSVWLSDHLFLSVEKYGGPPGEHDGIDPLVGLAGLARHTERVRLGTLVLCAQLRPGAVVAKALTSIDVLSGGRVIVGVGAGWYEPEYRAAGIDFQRPGVRVTQLEAAILEMKRMFAGPYLPPPVQQPHPPIWVGGIGPKLLDVVARHADGWNIGGWTRPLASCREAAAALERACVAVGRDPATVVRSLNRYVVVGERATDVGRRPHPAEALAGTPDQLREQVAAIGELGVSSLVLNLGALPFQVTTVDDLELVASAFIQESS